MLRELLENFGKKYSDILEINLGSRKEEEIFKWFLISVLFGAPITERSVIKTYRCFQKHRVLTPEKIIATGWNGLVSILDEGSYTRYDFRTSDKLLEVMGNLLRKYEGNLNLLHERASGSEDLEKRLKELGKGIGDATASIFLRELRGVWRKADPRPTPLEMLAAKNLKVIKTEDREKALGELKEFWRKNRIRGKDFIDFETALMKLGKDFCRKGKCEKCGFSRYCAKS